MCNKMGWHGLDSCDSEKVAGYCEHGGGALGEKLQGIY